jgi:hypothetical protein
MAATGVARPITLTCTGCGNQATTDSLTKLANAGWNISGPGIGLCRACANRDQADFDRRVAAQLEAARKRRQRR